MIISPAATKGDKKNTWLSKPLKTQYADSQEAADEMAKEILDSMSAPYRGEIIIVTGPISWKGERQENRIIKGGKIHL